VRFDTGSSPFLPPANSVSAVMREVLLALIPGVAALAVFFGIGVVVNLVIAGLTAMACEAAMLTLRGRPVKPSLGDCSALVTAALLAVALPPVAPWWLTVLAVAFALVFGKHLYGGLGYNPFNPAMVGYVVVLIAFPREMTHWLPPAGVAVQGIGPSETLAAIFSGHAPAVDALTAATPLDAVKTQLGMARSMHEILRGPLWGVLAGRGWEWVNLTFLAGGLWLLYRQIIGWRIPVGLIATLGLLAGVVWTLGPDRTPGLLFHLFSGGTMLGAFFIATDPVSAATTPRGRLIYGAGIGLITYVIRTWGGYPDGIAFAVLLMNMAAPLIDNYTRPRVFGH
jgi:electron transport complex protein RnfD